MTKKIDIHTMDLRHVSKRDLANWIAHLEGALSSVRDILGRGLWGRLKWTLFRR